MSIQSEPFIAKNEFILKYNIKDIWDIIVDNENYEWRSGVKKIKIIENGNKWIEYYDKKLKYFTEFTLLGKKEYQVYSFKIENKNFYGNWYGEFIAINQNEAKIIFTEVVFTKNKIMYLIAKLFWDIKKKQKIYIRDLINKLEKVNIYTNTPPPPNAYEINLLTPRSKRRFGTNSRNVTRCQFRFFYDVKT